jgi:GDP-L-fucose synthase
MKIYVTGHRGMVGSAVVRRLGDDAHVPSWMGHQRGPDLREPGFDGLFSLPKVDAIVHAAGTVGGIGANQAYPVEFLADNVLIGANVLAVAHRVGVNRLVNLGSSCIYPRDCPQPMRPEHLLTGPLEPTNEGYALAKIAVLRLAQYYRREYRRSYVTVMPTNLYGTGDKYDEHRSHALPTLIMKFERARLEGGPVRLWGTGTALREFLHVDDLADAVALVLERYDDDAPLNIGSGEEITIAALAEMIADATGYEGEIEWNAAMPDGTPRKLLDSSAIRDLGWSPKVDLRTGIRRTVAEYRERSR